LISVGVSCGRFFESPLQGLGPIERGIPGAVSKEEALLMREYNPQGHSSEKIYHCQINHLFGGTPCAKAGKETIDGLLLCERHALEAKLEGQIECWRGMLFHIDLWSGEASRRDREDIVGLLEVQRAEATSARQRARTDLDRLRRSDTSLGSWGRAVLLTRGLLKRGSLPLPPRAVRPLALGLRRLQRR
jgi:hypothetical protein